MLKYLSRRLGITRARLARRIAISFAVVATLLLFASAQSREKRSGPAGASSKQALPDDHKTIQVHIAWLDEETLVLAFRNPKPPKQIVLGIANASLKEGQAGNLYEIPGFEDAIPKSDLDSFRAALARQETIPQNKYEILRYSSETKTYPLSEVDATFLDYVRHANTQSGDVEVWDISSTPPDKIRVVFLGDLVLVRPTQISTAQRKAEDALALVLANLAFKENKGARSVALTRDCARAFTDIETLRQNPVSIQARQNLLNGRSGGMNGSEIADNTFEVTNSGWVNHTLHLEFSPVPSHESNFQVTADVGPKAETIFGPRDLEVPPCEVAKISIAPSWYYVFQDKIGFNYKDSKLNATFSEPRLRWNWIIGGLVFIVVILVVWALWPSRQKGPDSDKNWSSKIKAGLEIKPSTGGVISGTSYQDDSPRGDWGWWERLRKRFRRKHREPIQQGSQTPDKADWQIVLKEYQESSTRLLDYVRASLPKLQAADETVQQLQALTKALDAERTEHKSWQDQLESLGNSPAAIIETAEQRLRDKKSLEAGIQKVQALFNDVGPTDNAKQESVDLEGLRRKVNSLKKLKEGYEDASKQVVAVLTPGQQESSIVEEPGKLVVMFRQLRNVTDQVVQTYAEHLRSRTEVLDFEKQSLADIEKRLPELRRLTEALKVLQTNERIYVARLLAVRIRQAGEQLLELERLDGRYGPLFTGTEMELTDLGQQLITASQFADDVLTGELVRQVWRENGQAVRHNQIDEALIAFLRQFLSDKYKAIRNMLRLWQVTDVYCLTADDPLAAALYKHSEAFRHKCVQILSDFECLGVSFHKIRFLQDPSKNGLTFRESPSVPPIQSNPKLFKPIQGKLDSNFGEDYWKTVADVDSWGLECELDPERNCETELWLWRALSLRSHER
jgi:hypothetical protein